MCVCLCVCVCVCVCVSLRQVHDVPAGRPGPGSFLGNLGVNSRLEGKEGLARGPLDQRGL